MQSTCLLDHSVEVTIPSFLCRACHPELNARVASQPNLTAEAEMLEPRWKKLRTRGKLHAKLLLQRSGSREETATAMAL